MVTFWALPDDEDFAQKLQFLHPFPVNDKTVVYNNNDRHRKQYKK